MLFELVDELVDDDDDDELNVVELLDDDTDDDVLEEDMLVEELLMEVLVDELLMDVLEDEVLIEVEEEDELDVDPYSTITAALVISMLFSVVGGTYIVFDTPGNIATVWAYIASISWSGMAVADMNAWEILPSR